MIETHSTRESQIFLVFSQRPLIVPSRYIEVCLAIIISFQLIYIWDLRERCLRVWTWQEVNHQKLRRRSMRSSIQEGVMRKCKIACVACPQGIMKMVIKILKKWLMCGNFHFRCLFHILQCYNTNLAILDAGFIFGAQEVSIKKNQVCRPHASYLRRLHNWFGSFEILSNVYISRK